MTTTAGLLDEAVRHRLHYLRWFRRAMIWALLGPVGLTALIVVVSRLTGGGLRFLVNGDPWTYWFWNGLFSLMVIGFLMALRTMVRFCPACGGPWAQGTGAPMRRVRAGEAQIRYGARRNAFTSRCLSCGVSVSAKS